MSIPQVYLMWGEGTDRYKIGMSTDPESRKADLQIGSPVPLVLVWHAPGSAWMEARLHQVFAADRVHGEWFRSEGTALEIAVPAAYRALVLAKPGLVLRDERPAPTPTHVRQKPKSVERGDTHRDRVLSVIRSGTFRARDVAKTTGINKGNVSRAVSKLIEMQMVYRDQDGYLYTI